MGFLATVAAGVPWTVALTLSAFLMGAILGLPLCLMLLSSAKPLRLLARTIILALRSVPPIVWLFLIFFGFGSGLIQISPFEAALVGLGLIVAANMAEVYRGAFAAIPMGEREAAIALGLPLRDRFLDVIAPQLVRIALPSAATYAINLLKDTAIASTIGVQEVAFQAYHLSQVTFHSLDIFAIAGLFYIVLSLVAAWATRRIDASMKRSLAR